MESINYKGLLQTWIQRKSLSLPIYNTSRIGGTDCQPIFRSTVRVNGREFTGQPEGSKIQAEQKAANQAYNVLLISDNIPVPSKVPNWISDPVRTLIVVDLDNRPRGLEELSGLQAEIIGFAGKLSSSARNNFIVPSGTKRIIVDSTAKDGADIGIIVDLVRRLERGFDQRVFLLTGDHFGTALGDILRSEYPKVKFFHCTTSSEVKSLF
jgi:hypothetical protein